MPERLTDLEAVCLGCVTTRGPCTAYFVRRQFQKSPSSRFTGSAGAIYPLLRRLEERGLLTAESTATGKRQAVEYAVTRAGRTALKAWLRSSLAPGDVATDDPLRTRMLFLEALPPAARLEWLDAAEAAVRAQADAIAAYEASAPETPFTRLANDNARRLDRARLAWLAKAREMLSGE